MTFRARKPSGPDVSGDVRATGGLIDVPPKQREFETIVHLRRTETFEYSLLGLLTASIAVVAGTLAAWGVLHLIMGIDWLFVPGAAFGTALLCTGITLFLGFVGTWQALGRKAAPLLRNQ